jgi:hypothetical protein
MVPIIVLCSPGAMSQVESFVQRQAAARDAVVHRCPQVVLVRHAIPAVLGGASAVCKGEMYVFHDQREQVVLSLALSVADQSPYTVC